MKWFSKSEAEPAATRESTQPEAQQYTSLALNALLHRLRPNRKYNILDLGPASGANVDFYSQFSAKIHIEDLHQTLSSFDFLSPEDGVSLDSVFRYLLPYQKGTRFDIILGWDVFNYLEPREFLGLTRHIARFCSHGALLFALISTQESLPEQPSRYTILDNQTLLYEITSTIQRRCPRYQETDLAHMMPGFRPANSFLLRNGFKEYLFSCQRHRS